MQESITIADVGSMVNVSGSRIATPFGPPRPGSTPTKIPSTSPTIISDNVLKVSSTSKPCHRSWSASILEPEPALDRALRHDHVERDVEGHEHRTREDEAREQRLPPGDAADIAHEARDEEEARDVDAEPLREQAEDERRDEHLQHPPQLVAVDERGFSPLAVEERLREAEQARSGEQKRQVEGEVARLWPVGSPAGSALPVVPPHQRREGEEEDGNDDVDRARARDGARFFGRVRHLLLIEPGFDHQ